MLSWPEKRDNNQSLGDLDHDFRHYEMAWTSTCILSCRVYTGIVTTIPPDAPRLGWCVESDLHVGGRLTYPESHSCHLRCLLFSSFVAGFSVIEKVLPLKGRCRAMEVYMEV